MRGSQLAEGRSRAQAELGAGLGKIYRSTGIAESDYHV